MSMKKSSLSTIYGLLAPAAFISVGAAQASSVVYVSGKGADSNACTVAAPCLTFQGAYGKVDAGGIIIALDSASYGPLTITKSVSVINDGGGVADVQRAEAGKNAITINDSAAIVHLRGLSVDGGGVGVNGVYVVSAASVTISNCVIRRFIVSGVLARPTAAGMALSVIDSTVSDNARGIYLYPNGGALTATLSNVEATGNSQQGVYATGTVSAAVTGGIFSRSAQGVYAGAGASVSVRDAVANNNSGAGFLAYGAGAVLRLAHSIASGNYTGLQASNGGLAETYSDNNLRANNRQVAGATAVVRQ